MRLLLSYYYLAIDNLKVTPSISIANTFFPFSPLLHIYFPDLSCEPLEDITPSKQKIIDQLLVDNQIVKVNDYVNQHRNIAINLKRLNDGRQLNRKEQQKTVSWKRFNWDLNNPKNGVSSIAHQSGTKMDRERDNSLSIAQKRKTTTCLF